MKWFKNLSKDSLLYGGLILTFIVLYGATAFVSWYHAITFFSIANAIWLSVLLSFVAEVGQASALFSILLTDNRKKLLTWSVMSILTALQVIGNVYASYDWIDKHNGAGVEVFRKAILFWMTAADPEIFKVVISWISGALLPIIALAMTALVAQNMILRNLKAKTKLDYDSPPSDSIPPAEPIPPAEQIDARDIISEVSKIRPTKEELDELEQILKAKDEAKKQEDYMSPEAQQKRLDKAIEEFEARTEPPVKEKKTTEDDDSIVWVEDQQKMIDELEVEQKEAKEKEKPNRPDTSDEIHEEWNKIYDEINKEVPPSDQLTNEEVIPHYSDEEINEMNLDEYERTGLYNDDLDKDAEALTPEIVTEPIDIVVKHDHGLVEGVDLVPGVINNLTEEEKKPQKEDRLERIRRIAREQEELKKNNRFWPRKDKRNVYFW